MRDASRTVGGFLKSRAWRRLVPFALWLVLYRIPNMARGHLTVPLTFNNLLMGLGTNPLWSLPFAFIASFLALMFTPRHASAVGAGTRGSGGRTVPAGNLLVLRGRAGHR